MKDKNRMVTVVIALALISFMSLSFAASYSYITYSKVGNNIEQITTTNINFTTSVTNRTGTTFDFDYDASKYATITVNKPAGYDTIYYILVGHSSTTVNATNQTNFIPYEDLWLGVYNASSNGAPTTPITNPSRVLDNIVFTPSSATYASGMYTAYFGHLDSTTTSKKLSLVVWGDPDHASLYDDRVVNMSIQVYQYPAKYRAYYNISGYVYDSSNNPVSGATVLLQNGSVSATTDSNGSYTLYNVPNGTHKLDVLDNTNSELYSTTIRVYTGTKGITKKNGTSYAATRDWYLQRAAYNTYTTPYKILIKNTNITTDSNYKPTVAYTTEVYYAITVPDSLEVTNVGANIKFDTDHKLALTYVAS